MRFLSIVTVASLLVTVQSAPAAESESLPCRELLAQRQAEAERLISQEDFPALSELVAQWGSRRGEDGVLAQLIIDWPGTIDYLSAKVIDELIQKSNITTLQEYSSLRPTSEGRLRHTKVVMGTKNNFRAFLQTDFSPIAQYQLKIYLDPIAITGSFPQTLKIFQQMRLDNSLAQEVLNPKPAAPKSVEDEILGLEEVGRIFSSNEGAFSEFAARFAYFTEPGMALAIFARLAKYLPSEVRELYFVEISALDLKRSSTAMAKLPRYAKPREQLVMGLLIFAKHYTFRNKRTKFNPNRVVHKGGVTELFDELGLPEKMSIDPSKERLPKLLQP